MCAMFRLRELRMQALYLSTEPPWILVCASIPRTDLISFTIAHIMCCLQETTLAHRQYRPLLLPQPA
jgi:hypothetical protein